ncbi:MAG: T9SS type A sorting domain-containing protein, partial [Bacteroidota bacterium]
VNYPYDIDDVISIYDSFYGPTYYYYFYEWTVATPSWTCPSDRVEVTVSVVSVEEIAELSSFNTYPNPADNELNVELELVQNSAVNIELFDISGRTVYSKQANMMGATRTIIPVSQYEAGLYTLAVMINGQRVVEKIIVE